MSNTTAAQAIFKFITGDQLDTHIICEVATKAVRFALNCHDFDIIVDMRKLNARPKHNTLDKFWAKMAEMVEGRVSDRRHGELKKILLLLIFLVLWLPTMVLLLLMEIVYVVYLCMCM